MTLVGDGRVSVWHFTSRTDTWRPRARKTFSWSLEMDEPRRVGLASRDLRMEISGRTTAGDILYSPILDYTPLSADRPDVTSIAKRHRCQGQ